MTIKPKLISLGVKVPLHCYTQREVFNALGYPGAYWRLSGKAGIDQRYFCIPLEEAIGLSFQQQQEKYREHAVRLSVDAITRALDGRDITDVGCLIFGSCTGVLPGPTAADYISSELGMTKYTEKYNNTGMGCGAAFPGLKHAYDYVKAHGDFALAVNCELSSLAYYPENPNPDPENDFELLRANSIFADMAAAALIGTEDDDTDWRHPYILDTEVNYEHQYADDLGFVWRNGRLRCRLSRRVPELAPIVTKPAVDEVLKRNDLKIEDVDHWIIHAAGNSVITNIARALNLPEEKLTLSRETLQLCGNTSSTSVMVTGKRLMEQGIMPGQYIAMIAIGPGMYGSMTLLKFGSIESKK
jgi:alkylresorcinol/alkylpyrone synthase